MSVAIFGGTFNPVHIGHMFIAEETLRSLHYDKIVFVPAYKPAHKNLSPLDDPYHRLEMLKIATKDVPEFEVEPCEIERKGVSYTLDTIYEIINKYQVNGKPGLIIGDDLVPGFPQWYKVNELVEMVDVVIARRHTDEKLDFQWSHSYIDNIILQVSSTDVRQRIENLKACKYLLPSGVYEYIIEKQLYKTI